jgi:nucleoside-diphosphate-sugar epimerase
MKIFVAGGTGVLGRPSLEALLAAGHQVRSTARGAEKAALVRKLGAEPVDVDLYDLNAIRKAIAGSDALVRLTTKIGTLMKMGNQSTWEETNRLRTTGAHTLVDAALAEGVPTYIHESVTFVYRDGGANWLPENTPTDDAGSAILRATLQGEQEAARFSNTGGRGIVLRFAGFYGEEAPSTAEAIKLARRRMLFQIGPASNYFSSIYVPDAGRAVAAALEAPSGIYNVSDDEPVPFAEYLRTLTQALHAPQPRRLPAFLGKWLFGAVSQYLSRSHRVSNARLKEVSSWRPSVKSVAEGWPRVAAALG